MMMKIMTMSHKCCVSVLIYTSYRISGSSCAGLDGDDFEMFTAHLSLSIHESNLV